MSYYQQCDGDSSTFCRHDLLNWLNSTLSLRMNRVEDTCNGAAFCQVIDILHPNSINLGKVNFNARDSYEREKNYKILQQAFTKAGINKTLEVDRLIEGKPMALLEFLQWLKWYYNMSHGDLAIEGYGNPCTRRKQMVVPTSKASHQVKNTNKTQILRQNNAPIRASNKDGSSLKLKQELAELKVINTALERERDFYFGKLRDLEVACERHRSTLNEDDDNTDNESVIELLHKLQKIFGPDGSYATTPSAAMKSPSAMNFWKVQETLNIMDSSEKEANVERIAADQNSPLLLFS